MSKLYFRQLLLGQMENFVYLIGDAEKKECWVVDPAWDVQGVLDVAQEDGMRVTGALVTHYHPDHIGGSLFGFSIEGLPELIELNPCKIHTHHLEAEGVIKVTGVSKNDIVTHHSGDIVKVGDIAVELIHTPGHTPGSQCFKLKDALVSGDTLFLTGCGRVDLPGGNPEDMHRSLTEKLGKLSADTILYPGHSYGGVSAPLGEVMRHNRHLF